MRRSVLFVVKSQEVEGEWGESVPAPSKDYTRISLVGSVVLTMKSDGSVAMKVLFNADLNASGDMDSKAVGSLLKKLCKTVMVLMQQQLQAFEGSKFEARVKADVDGIYARFAAAAKEVVKSLEKVPKKKSKNAFKAAAALSSKRQKSVS
jgi:hypothetical protein